MLWILGKNFTKIRYLKFSNLQSNSRFEFISAYEGVESCLKDNVVNEITQRVEYFLDHADAAAVKHTFDVYCPSELAKVEARESQKVCTFLLYIYLVIEEKRQEILTIMLSLLYNSENFEELTSGYLNVQSHQRQLLNEWVTDTFSSDVYCGIFVYHEAAWENKMMKKETQNFISHISPGIDFTDPKSQCIDQGKS